jgi:hypothetical protein
MIFGSFEAENTTDTKAEISHGFVSLVSFVFTHRWMTPRASDGSAKITSSETIH